jgi:hypothetical protein
VQWVRRGDVDYVDFRVTDELFVIAICALGADLTGLDRIASRARDEPRAGRNADRGCQVVEDDMTDSDDTPARDAARVQDAIALLVFGRKKAGTEPGFPCCNLSA